MRRYRIEFQTAAQRQLRDLSERLRAEAAEIILDLRDEPHPPSSKPLGRELQGRCSIAFDGWRIIYTVYEQDGKIIIWKIRKRDANTYLNVP